MYEFLPYSSEMRTGNEKLAGATNADPWASLQLNSVVEPAHVHAEGGIAREKENEFYLLAKPRLPVFHCRTQ